VVWNRFYKATCKHCLDGKFCQYLFTDSAASMDNFAENSDDDEVTLIFLLYFVLLS